MNQIVLGHSTANEFHKVEQNKLGCLFFYPVPQSGGIGERRIKTLHELSGPEPNIMAAH